MMETNLMMQVPLAVPDRAPFPVLCNWPLRPRLPEAKKARSSAKFIDLAEQIATMPKTYEQDGRATRRLRTRHYFCRRLRLVHHRKGHGRRYSAGIRLRHQRRR